MLEIAQADEQRVIEGGRAVRGQPGRRPLGGGVIAAERIQPDGVVVEREDLDEVIGPEDVEQGGGRGFGAVEPFAVHALAVIDEQGDRKGQSPFGGEDRQLLRNVVFEDQKLVRRQHRNGPAGLMLDGDVERDEIGPASENGRSGRRPESTPTGPYLQGRHLSGAGSRARGTGSRKT